MEQRQQSILEPRRCHHVPQMLDMEGLVLVPLVLSHPLVQSFFVTPIPVLQNGNLYSADLISGWKYVACFLILQGHTVKTDFLESQKRH